MMFMSMSYNVIMSDMPCEDSELQMLKSIWRTMRSMELDKYRYPKGFLKDCEKAFKYASKQQSQGAASQMPEYRFDKVHDNRRIEFMYDAFSDLF